MAPLWHIVKYNSQTPEHRTSSALGKETPRSVLMLCYMAANLESREKGQTKEIGGVPQYYILQRKRT
jgi:hypothetical protein